MRRLSRSSKIVGTGRERCVIVARMGRERGVKIEWTGKLAVRMLSGCNVMPSAVEVAIL
jgi:hypothetical protein